MMREAAPLEPATVASIGDGIIREARHADASAALAESPVPDLLNAVNALQSVLLAANPAALRARVGLLGRLLGRDLVLEAEGNALRERLRVLVHDATARLAGFIRFDEAIAMHEQRLLASIEALGAAIEELGPSPSTPLPLAEVIERRRHHLLTLQQAWRITATQLALTRFNHRQLAQRIQPMLPLVQTLLEQQHAAHAARDSATSLQSASDALASANALLAGYSPTHPAAPEHAP